MTRLSIPILTLVALVGLKVVQGAEDVSVELCVDDPESTPGGRILLGTWSKPPPDASVLVGFTVTKEGTVRDVSVIAKEPEFLPTGNAIEYAKQFTYDPRVVDGEAIHGVQHLIKYRARVVDESYDQSAAADAYRCFRVPDDPYWRSVLEE